MDCLRLAGERRLEFNIARNCQAQAMSLMREAKSALRRLERTQSIRRGIEADPAAAERAVWVEHGVLGMMEVALAEVGAADEVAGGVRGNAEDGSGGDLPTAAHEGGNRCWGWDGVAAGSRTAGERVLACLRRWDFVVWGAC